jgi:hypothetical protein
VLGLGQDTPNRTVVVALGWLRQVRPPSVLRRIVPRDRIPLSPPPLPPTATQVLGLGQATPYARLGVPLSGLGWLRQVRPPSVLRRIVPPSARATQVLGLGQATPNNWGLAPGWLRQVRPPSVLRRIVPEFPTATQVLGLGQATPSRPLSVPLSGLGWLRQVRPPSVLRRIRPLNPTATQVLGRAQAT